MRSSRRQFDEMREVTIETNVNRHAEGSCIIRMGNTHVLCTASVDETVPAFLRGKNKGWVTAEYSMLPRSTHSRIRREVNQGKPSGRTSEIQRLISRSLRSAVNLSQLGERQIIVDCDVLQADGGTRTASITGGFVALSLALRKVVTQGMSRSIPIIEEIAAISCGISAGNIVVDLDYNEDNSAEVDANFVMTASGKIIEIQGTAEGAPFGETELNTMLTYAKNSTKKLIEIRRAAIAKVY